MYGHHTGKDKLIIENIPLYLPEPGYVFNYHKNKFENIGVVDLGNKWVREGLPEWWEKERNQEIKKQASDPSFFMEQCENYRKIEWKRRLYGFWFVNKGIPEYITGSDYMYLQWWWLGKKYPGFRKSDQKYFWIQQWMIECPFCYGMIDLAQRQTGKTARSALFLYEYPSRTVGATAGIQSKSLEEARDTVYRKAILTAFYRLPDFFIPDYDKASRLSTGMRFSPSITVGKYQDMSVVHGSLGGGISYEDSKETACDGKSYDRYVADEVFKTINVDILARHEVILPMLAPEGEIVGKALYTSTVEDMEEKNENSVQMWHDSDQSEVDIEGGEMTATGLIRLFTPAYDNYRVDEYGYAPVEANKTYFLSERKKRHHNLKVLNGYIRKHAFTAEEAFRFTTTTSIFNQITIQDAMDNITFRNNDFMRRGNFQWVERDHSIRWEDDPLGRIKTVWLMEDHPELISPYKDNFPRPKNGGRLSFGVDPFDHYKDSKYHKYSDGSGYVKTRDSIPWKDRHYNDCFILQYLFRPESPFEYFEDMIKVAFYYSVPMLFEDQADGIRHYFDERGYGHFLQWLPGATKPGISSSQKAKENMVILFKKHFSENKDRHYFKELLEQMLRFDILNTRKYDAVMGAGYTLISEDSYLSSHVDNNRIIQETKIVPLASLSRKYKVR